jgi:hypothetical protein
MEKLRIIARGGPSPGRAISRMAREVAPIKSGSTMMWEVINSLYREYCLARLHEIRQLQLSR